MENLWQKFVSTASRVPTRPAIIKGADQFTFREWRERAESFSQTYRELGLKSGDRVLLWMENSFDMAAALVGAWGVDAIPVIMDSGCRGQQYRHAIKNVAARVVVFESPLPMTDCDSGEVALVRTDSVATAAPYDTDVPTRSLPTDPASIVFTSGSTGRPKGVIQSHANLYRGSAAVHSYLQLEDGDRLLCPVPWSFDYGYGQLLTTVNYGITQILPVLQNPAGICKAIKQHSPNLLAGTPSVYSFLMGGMSPIWEVDCSSLRLLTNTGGTLHQNLIEKLLEQFSSAQLVLNYGLTESYRSCYLPPEYLEQKPGSIGLPIPGADIVIVREDGEIARPHEEGEIVHRGDYLFMGYWNNPQATASALRRDPLAPDSLVNGAPALYTGDIGFSDEDGFIYYKGRRDHQIKSMGVRVSPGEVEEILVNSGMVEYAAVFGVPHEILGQEIWAVVVPCTNIDFEMKKLQRYAREEMSQYMMPRRFLEVDSLPQTSTGKTDYTELHELSGAGR